MRALCIFFRSILLVVTCLMIAVYTQAQSKSAVSHNELAQEQEQEKTLRGKELHLTEAENPLTKAERAWLKEDHLAPDLYEPEHAHLLPSDKEQAFEDVSSVENDCFADSAEWNPGRPSSLGEDQRA